MRRPFAVYRSPAALGLLFAAYAAIAIWTLPDYGVTWDEIFHYISGDIYLEYFRTEVLRVEDNSNLRYYGPALDLVNAISNEQLHKNRNWLPEDVARHLPACILGILLVPMVYLMTAASAGRRAGFFAAFAMTLSPHFFSYLHNDPKDVGIAFFYTAFLWAATRRARGGSWIWGLFGAVMFGVGFAIKLTIVVAAPIVLVWLLLQFPRRAPRYAWSGAVERFAEAAVVIPLVGLLFGILFWPWLWVETLHRIYLVFHHFENVPWLGPVLYKGQILTTDKLGWDYAPTIFGLQNPPWILALAALGSLGIIRRWRRRRLHAGQLAFIGCAATGAAAIANPGQMHDGLRQLLPVIPLVSILAGYGAEGIWRLARSIDIRRAGRGVAARLFASILLLGIAGSAAYPIIALHPDQTAYFNFLTGGPAGADGKYEVEFYCNPYKRGMQWLDRNIEKPSRVLVAQNHWVAAYYNTGRITALPREQEGEYYMAIPRLYLDNITLPPNLEEIHRIKAGGATVLTIYRFRR